jgi:hypothetical protein
MAVPVSGAVAEVAVAVEAGEAVAAEEVVVVAGVRGRRYFMQGSLMTARE